MTQVILGKSRVREICMPGSVRAKAEWLSYSHIGRLDTSTEDPGQQPDHGVGPGLRLLF